MFYCVWSNFFRKDMNDKIIQKKTKYFDIRWLNKSKKNKHKDVLDFCARIFWSNFVSLKIKIETLIPTKIIDYYDWDEKNLVLHISSRIIQKSLNFRLSSPYNCFFPKNNVWKDWKYYPVFWCNTSFQSELRLSWPIYRVWHWFWLPIRSF